MRWRCIDEKYSLETYKAKRLAFGNGKIDSRAFTSEKAYLTKEVGGERLANRDMTGGSAIILEIDPPTTIPRDKFTDEQLQQCMVLTGAVVQASEVRKANTILIHIAENNADGKAVLQNFASRLSACGQLLSVSTVKCYPGNDGAPQYEFGSAISAGFQEIIINQIASTLAKVSGDQSPIEGIHAAVAAFVSAFNELEAETLATSVAFSDYKRSVDRIVKHFADSAKGPVIWARLENSKVTLTEVVPRPS